MNLFRQLILNKTSMLVLVRNYWRPKRKRTPYTKALVFNSGDQTDSIKIFSPKDFPPEFKNLEELTNANEDVKKMFSLEYQTKSKTHEKEIEEVIRLVQDHPTDLWSIEVQIARLTVSIRTGMKHCHIFRHDGCSRKSQEKRIQMRTDLLGKLKLLDREKFEWLTRQLKLEYKDPPLSEEEKADAAVDRSKRGLRRLMARSLADQLIVKKTEQLKAKLKVEREKFEVFKSKKLEEIGNEMIRLGLLAENSDGGGVKIPDLHTALKLLDHEHLIPKPQPEIPEWKAIYNKKLEIFMPKKKIEDDKILRANGFLTNDDLPLYPDKDFY